MSAGEQSTSALLAALTKHAPNLDTHVHNVVATSLKLGQHFGLDLKALGDLRTAATLHDIGKVAIPTTILDKPGPLDDAERTFVRTHTLIGETIMQAAPSLGAAARFVRHSHERYDGTGYPDHLTGEDIPLESRIISVCDAFDAMTTNRPYAPTRTIAEALDELQRNAGTRFDPAVVTAFAALPAEAPATGNTHDTPAAASSTPQLAAA
jgi:HD-GYP domain-containing protein (c-di-GMP phosphodiesterase class II)